jgi:hypothetical protein
MAELREKPVINVKTSIELSELELRALYAITEYGFEAFTKVFYEHMGKSIEKYEPGLATLFDSIREMAPPIFRRIDDARSVFVGQKKIKY